MSKLLTIAVIAVFCAIFVVASAVPAKRASYKGKRDYTAKLYDLLPGRYPDAVSLPDVLSSLDKTPEGRQAIMMLIEYVQNRTKVQIPEFALDYILDHAELLCDYLALTPLEMHDLAIEISLVEGGWNYTHPKTVQQGFTYPTDINNVEVNMTDWLPTISEIAPDVWWGFFFPNTTSLQQAKTNIVMSLVFNQLSANSHIADASQHFYVQYNGQRYTDVKGFLAGLMAAEPQKANISTYLTKRIAAFFGLYITKNGKYYEVADPMFVASQLFDKKTGEEAIVPALHSEFVIDVNAAGTFFEVVWYEGDDGIGFFPGQMYVLESWVGDGISPAINGTDAIEAVEYMSLFGDILLQVAYKMHLFDWGYAISGVCDDSCGAIEILTAGFSTEFPNLMVKSIIVPEIMERLKLQDKFSPYYYRLMDVINHFPMDWRQELDSTVVERALGCIVWPVGQEPFQSVVDARRILQGLADEQRA